MTTDAQQALAQVREAIAAGPRPGEWRVSKYRDGRQALIYDADDFEVARVCYPNRDADAALIAACSPANMTAILDHVEAQAAEIERLTAALNTCVWALRQPLDDWKGECERKALDEARDALKEQR
jgi:hypothetical protein